MAGEEGESEIVCIFTENHSNLPITPPSMLSSFFALRFTYSDDNAEIRHGIGIFLPLLVFLRRSVQVKVTLLAGLSYKLAYSALSMLQVKCDVMLNSFYLGGICTQVTGIN